MRKDGCCNLQAKQLRAVSDRQEFGFFVETELGSYFMNCHHWQVFEGIDSASDILSEVVPNLA